MIKKILTLMDKRGTEIMTIKKKEVVKILEDIINRLDEVMTDSLMISNQDEVDYKGRGF